MEGNCRQVSAVPFFNDSIGQWGRAGTAPPVADEACPPQGSGPIFTARRVWKSVCRNESTSFPGTFPVVAPYDGFRLPPTRPERWSVPGRGRFLKRPYGGHGGGRFCLEQIQRAVQIDGLPDFQVVFRTGQVVQQKFQHHRAA